MSSAKKALSTTAVAALIGISALIVSAGPASARIVCNAEGDCWHTDSSVSIGVPGLKFTYHPDHWYFHQTWGSDRRYREYHAGRGYWKGGVWIGL